MQGKTLYTILLAIIAVLTLALAVLVIFLFTTINANKANTKEAAKTQTADRVVPPEEQAEFKLYATGDDAGKTQNAIFNIRSTEEHSNSFIMASISIIYDGGVKNEFLEKRKTLFEKTYLSELKQATIEYFRGKTFDELQATDSMQVAREALKEIYSKIISEDPEEKIILKIVFDKWIIQ